MCLVDLMGELPDFSMGPHHSLAYNAKGVQVPLSFVAGQQVAPFQPLTDAPEESRDFDASYVGL